MRLITVLTIAAAAAGLAFAASAAETIPGLPPGAWEGWGKKHDEFKTRMKEGNVGVIFFGDSITAGWAGSAGIGIWKKNYEPVHAVNFGIGSDTVPLLLWRIQNGELEGADPKAVVLLIGTNNIGGDPKKVAEGIARIVEAIRAMRPKTKVLLLGIFPRTKATDAPKIMENVRKVNADLAKLDDKKNVRFVDLADKFAPGGVLNTGFFSDGVHLTTKGYQVWADGIAPVLEPMMR